MMAEKRVAKSRNAPIYPVEAKKAKIQGNR